MNKTGIGFILLAGLLVFGLFAYSNWDQTNAAAAKTEMEIQLDRQPEVVQATAEWAMTVLSKVIAGVVVSLLVAIGIFAYQQARINELKNGGWERFWQRRRPPQVKQANPKKPSVQDLVTMLLLRDVNRNDKNRKEIL